MEDACGTAMGQLWIQQIAVDADPVLRSTLSARHCAPRRLMHLLFHIIACNRLNTNGVAQMMDISRASARVQPCSTSPSPPVTCLTNSTQYTSFHGVRCPSVSPNLAAFFSVATCSAQTFGSPCSLSFVCALPSTTNDAVVPLPAAPPRHLSSYPGKSNAPQPATSPVRAGWHRKRPKVCAPNDAHRAPKMSWSEGSESGGAASRMLREWSLPCARSTNGGQGIGVYVEVAVVMCGSNSVASTGGEVEPDAAACPSKRDTKCPRHGNPGRFSQNCRGGSGSAWPSRS